VAEKIADWREGVYNPAEKSFMTKKWIALSDRVRSRDNWECQACTSYANLTVHHIKPRSEGGKDIMKNLTTLCRECHDRAELGEDIYAVEPTPVGENWQSWVYGGCKPPPYEER